jgi:F-type H+-transporting ATPase subunit delta
MDNISELANRYASALFLCAKEKGSVEQTLEELNKISVLVDQNQALEKHFSSPIISREEKKSLAVEICSSLNLNQLVLGLMSLLAENARLEKISEISQAFIRKCDDENGVVRGSLKAARPLSDDEKKMINVAVEKATNKKVVLETKEEPNLLGGLVAEVGSYRFDGSLVSQIENLKEDLNRSVD